MLNHYGDCAYQMCGEEVYSRTNFLFRDGLEGEEHAHVYESTTTVYSERYCAADETGREDNFVMRVEQSGGYFVQGEKLALEPKPETSFESQAELVFRPTSFTITLPQNQNPMYSWPDGTCETAVEYLNANCPCGGTWGKWSRTVDTLLECDGLSCPAFFKQMSHSHSMKHDYNDNTVLVLTAPSTDFSSHKHESQHGWALQQTSVAGCVRPAEFHVDGENNPFDFEESEEEGEKPKCEDTNENCKQWSKFGYCEPGNDWYRFMILYCPVSCELTDHYPENCKYWASIGYCNPNPDAHDDYSEFMNFYCAASCHPDGPCDMPWNKPGGKMDKKKHPPPPPKNGGGNGGGNGGDYSSNDDYGGDDYGGGDNTYGDDGTYGDDYYGGGDNTYGDDGTYGDDYYGGDGDGDGTYSDEDGGYSGGDQNNYDDAVEGETDLIYMTGAVTIASAVGAGFYYLCIKKKPELSVDDYVTIAEAQT